MPSNHRLSSLNPPRATKHYISLRTEFSRRTKRPGIGLEQVEAASFSRKNIDDSVHEEKINAGQEPSFVTILW